MGLLKMVIGAIEIGDGRDGWRVVTDWGHDWPGAAARIAAAGSWGEGRHRSRAYWSAAAPGVESFGASDMDFDG